MGTSQGPDSGFVASGTTTAKSARDVLRPKILTTLRNYRLRDFMADLGAGVVVGVVALPLAIAFAIASGVSPEKGLVTAVVGGLLISALGGSRVQIGGPTGAFVVIVYGIVEQHGTVGLAVATFMAGALLIAMGLARLGAIMRFIPYPVIVGFTSGIAMIIASSQVGDFLGLELEAVPAEFFAKWMTFFRGMGSLSPAAVGTGLLCLAILVMWPRLSGRVPASLVALVVCTVVVRVFHIPVDTIGSRFGVIPAGIPAPHLPVLAWDAVRDLVPAAFAIAMLGGIESLLSATVADGMTGTRHRPNMELVAQGVANLASPLFGGIPATGAIARTATNVKNGARTPVAGILHAMTLLLIMLAFGKYAAWIPLPALSGILLLVAYHMSEWRTVRELLRGPRADILVLVTTFGLTVAVDLTVAIPAGVVLALLLFMKQMSDSVRVSAWSAGAPAGFQESQDHGDFEAEDMLEQSAIPGGVEVYEIDGPLFFGAAQKFEETVSRVSPGTRALVIRLRNLLSLDSTGIQALRRVHRNCRRRGIRFMLAGVHVQPSLVMFQSGFADEIGAENLFPDFDSALAYARRMTTPPADSGGTPKPE